MIFHARIDAALLKACIDAITAVVDEARLKISDDGWHVRAVDAANVALIDFELRSSAFEEYEISAQRNDDESGGASQLEIGVDFSKLSDIMRVGFKKEDVTLELNDKLHVKMNALSYTLSLISVETLRKEPKLPSLEFPTRIVLDAEDFKKAIKVAEKLGDHIVICVEGGSFFMEASSDMDSMRFTLGSEELISLSGDNARSIFSLDYIAAMSRAMNVETVTLYLGTDYPLKMEFELADGAASITYLLAPRIESD